jgi:lipoprotein-anchoring transpeptidase ErfK/SrfK
MLRRTMLTGLFAVAASPALAAPSWTGLFSPSAASIDNLLITVDLTTQEMVVTGGSRTVFTFDVSTGRKGYTTPTGSWRPIRMHKMWYSSKYENSPMPWSIFFYGGYAIHGTGDIKNLGRVASHGCVRLHPDNAKKLYDLVKEVGMSNTKVVLLRS